MKYSLSPEEKKKIEHLLRVQELNMEAADFYNSYLKGNLSYIDKPLIDDIVFNRGLDKDRAYFEAMREMQDLDPEDDELISLIRTCHIDKIKQLDPLDYQSDPFYRNIHFPREDLGAWEIGYNTFYPYEGFLYDEIQSKRENDYSEITSFGYFPTYFKYLTVSQHGQVWMSITPHEINTMKPSLNKAKGNILVFGLGLGYYPYIASLKNEVTSITIVEKDEDVISLFEKFILPQFQYKDKIKIIHDEAFNYAHNKMNKVKYDYAFVDLWKGEFDGLTMYLKMKKDEKINTGVAFSYWIEDSLLTMIRRSVLTLVEEEMSGSTEADYQKAGNIFDKVINRSHVIYKDLEIKNSQDLLDLLSDDNLKKLAQLI